MTDANFVSVHQVFYLKTLSNASINTGKNHFSTIGLIGTNEAVLDLIARYWYESKAFFAEKTLDSAIVCGISWKETGTITILRQGRLKAQLIDYNP